MSPITISFAESALADLEEARVWYAEQGVPEAGERLIAEVLQRVSSNSMRPWRDFMRFPEGEIVNPIKHVGSGTANTRLRRRRRKVG